MFGFWVFIVVVVFGCLEHVFQHHHHNRKLNHTCVCFFFEFPLMTIELNYIITLENVNIICFLVYQHILTRNKLYNCLELDQNHHKLKISPLLSLSLTLTFGTRWCRNRKSSYSRKVTFLLLFVTWNVQLLKLIHLLT